MSNTWMDRERISTFRHFFSFFFFIFFSKENCFFLWGRCFALFDNWCLLHPWSLKSTHVGPGERVSRVTCWSSPPREKHLDCLSFEKFFPPIKKKKVPDGCWTCFGIWLREALKCRKTRKQNTVYSWRTPNNGNNGLVGEANDALCFLPYKGRHQP